MKRAAEADPGRVPGLPRPAPQRILLTGATGLIGSAILARLHRDGHAIVAVRRPGGSAPPFTGETVTWRAIDVAVATRPADWLPHLAGVDAVVNAAGVFQDSARDSTTGVHTEGVAALFEACEMAGVRRVIHLSAIGVDRGTPSRFSETKLAGDRALAARALDWVILRPAVVVGRPAYGGSALFRGLAALPILPLDGNAGELQIVQLDDLVATVAFFLQPGAPGKVALEVCGPERLAFAEVIATYRRWLGWKPARIVALPRWAAGLAYRLGDLVGRLGWRPPIRSNAAREIGRGAVGDPGPWRRMTGIEPTALAAALAAEPASVQERWFARLHLLKPLVIGVFALFWIGTALISLGPGFAIGTELMREAGAGALAGPSVVAGALADLAIGVAMLFRRTARLALYGALALSLFYVVTGTILVPRLWADPLGPMLKIWPVMVLNLVALAIVDDR